MSEQKVLDKIMALLAKAEGTTHEAEADAYLAKAQALMIKHAVAESDLTPAEREQVTAKRVTIGNATADQTLMGVVARSADCRSVTHRSDRYTLTQMTIVGFASDIAYAQALYASLLLQREAALRRSKRHSSGENGRSYNHAFRIGYAGRIGQRLQDARKVTVEAEGTGAELVLLDRGAQTKAHLDSLFPKLSRGTALRVNSAAGVMAGRRAGDLADISGGRGTIHSNRKALA